MCGSLSVPRCPSWWPSCPFRIPWHTPSVHTLGGVSSSAGQSHGIPSVAHATPSVYSQCASSPARICLPLGGLRVPRRVPVAPVWLPVSPLVLILVAVASCPRPLVRLPCALWAVFVHCQEIPSVAHATPSVHSQCAFSSACTPSVHTQVDDPASTLGPSRVQSRQDGLVGSAGATARSDVIVPSDSGVAGLSRKRFRLFGKQRVPAESVDPRSRALWLTRSLGLAICVTSLFAVIPSLSSLSVGGCILIIIINVIDNLFLVSGSALPLLRSLIYCRENNVCVWTCVTCGGGFPPVATKHQLHVCIQVFRNFW